MVDFRREMRGGRDDDRGRDSGRSRDDDRGSRDAPRGGRDDDRGGRREPARDEYRGSGASAGFKYTPRTREQVEKRATAGASDFDKILKPHIKVYVPRKGENRVRILPATWPNPVHYGYDIYVHYGVGPDRQAYLDLSRMLNKPDPISEERDALRRSGRGSEQEIRDLNSTRRVLTYIVDRLAEEDGVQAWPMAQTLDTEINAMSVDPDTKEVLNIDDPDEGYDVTFTKQGEKLGTKYSGVRTSRHPSKLAAKHLDYAMEFPLPDQLQFFSYEQIAKEFGGGGAHRERDDARDGGGRDSPRGQERNEGDDRGRDAPRGRDADDGRNDRGRAPAQESRDDRSRDERDTRGAERGGRGDKEEITYAAVMAMDYDSLVDLIADDRRLSACDPKESKDDDELRKWVCDDLKLSPPTERETARRSVARPTEDTNDRLAAMRAERERR